MGSLNPNLLLGMGTGISGLAGLGSAYSQATAASTQAAYQKQQYETNARLAEYSAEDAVSRGEDSATQIKRQGKQLIGKQRAALAAQGVDVNDGSAADLQVETGAQVEQEVLRTKTNAWREAWGYKVQANQSQGQGAFAQMAGANIARNTILTGGLNFVGDAMKTGYAFTKGK